MDFRKLPTQFLFAALLFGGVTFAGPIVVTGQHPNLDSQFAVSAPFDLAAELARQFPQSAFVYQPPLVGYFSPQDPAALVIWTSIAPSSNSFMARWLDADVAPCANGGCVLALSPQTGGAAPSGGSTNRPPSVGGGGGAVPIDPGASPIPESGSLGMLGIGATAWVACQRKRKL